MMHKESCNGTSVCNILCDTVSDNLLKNKETRWRAFGEWLEKYRIRKGINQDTAAVNAGINRQQWYRIITGQSGTKLETVVAMAEAVDAPVKEALNRAGFDVPVSEPTNGLTAESEYDEEMRAVFYEYELMTEQQKAEFRPIWRMIKEELRRRKAERERSGSPPTPAI